MAIVGGSIIGGNGNGGISKGTQTLRVSYKDADEVYIHPGQIHIVDGSDKYPAVTSVITKQLTGLSNDTFYALYVNPTNATNILAATDIEFTTTMPTLNNDKQGYYHPTNTTWRCISFVFTNGSGNIVSFYTANNKYYYNFKFNDFVWNTVGAVRTDVITSTPMGELVVFGTWMIDGVSTNCHISTGGADNQEIHQYSNAGRVSMHFEVKTDSSKQISLIASGNTNMQEFTRGFFLPDEMYTK